MPRIRVIRRGTLEVAGAIEVAELQMSNATAFKIEDREVPIMAVFAKTPYWIDNGSNPIQEADRGSWDMPSTRIEYFLIVEEEFLGRVPGWVRLPPKRIMSLSGESS